MSVHLKHKCTRFKHMSKGNRMTAFSASGVLVVLKVHSKYVTDGAQMSSLPLLDQISFEISFEIKYVYTKVP